MEPIEQERLKPIDLEVLNELYKRAYLPKTADKISNNLNINYYYTLKILTKLEKKAYASSGRSTKKENATKKTITLKFAN